MGLSAGQDTAELQGGGCPIQKLDYSLKRKE